jgi:hypothetical protein
MLIKKNLLQQISIIFNISYFFLAKYIFSNKKNSLNIVLLFLLSLYILSQSLGLAHLSSHNYRHNLKNTHPHFSENNKIPNQDIYQKNVDDQNNCYLCFFANFQKLITNIAVILLAIILISFIYKIRLKLFDDFSQHTAFFCRAPPIFA